MKIVILSKVLPQPRGISGSIIVYNRIRHLVDRGHEVRVLSFVEPEEAPFAEALRPLVRELELVPAPAAESLPRRLARHVVSARPSPFHDAFTPEMMRRVGALVDRAACHVAIAEFSVMGQYLFCNPYLPAVRRIVSCHECCTKLYATAIRFHGKSLPGLLKRIGIHGVRVFEFAMYRAMDHILVLTAQEQSVLLKEAPDLRITVVPHGVDTAYFAPRSDAGDRREPSLVFVGYYYNETNRDAVRWFARTAWRRLRADYPALRFYVVGRGATSAIVELGRRDPRIVVTGEVADLRPYLGAGAIFICPIRMGSGFRAKILEALASGIPVVSTSLGAEGLMAGGGDAILLADTAERMEAGIRLLLNDPCLRERLGANGRNLAVNRFERERGLAALDRALEEAMARM